jgi:uncharacterized protein (DUF1501 family)
MKWDRRSFLLGSGAVSLASVGALLAPSGRVHAADYKAVVVVFLTGGHDGNNVLVPLDGAYADYYKARPSLALPKDSLLRLSGTHIGHSFGFTPSIRPLHELFERKRVAVVANVGALIEPTTVSQVQNKTAKLPPFLGSHSDQEQWIQGWMGDEDLSGWGGRSMDRLPAELRQRQPLISVANNYTALISNATPLSLADSGGSSNWGVANISDPRDTVTQRLEWATRLQSSNAYEAEFARSMRAAYLDSQEFAQGREKGPTPSGDFPTSVTFSRLPRDLAFLAKHIGYSKSVGARRQIYLVQDGGYDTHTGQLDTSTDNNAGLDRRLEVVAQSLSAFDKSIVDMGLDSQVLTLVISEFGRTLDPQGAGGSDHAWGNHWFAMGGAVKGGTVYGSTFPTLQTGGPDDASLYNPKRGQWIPQFSSDQFVADAMRWMGLTAEQTVAAMPNLSNFKSRTVGYI